MISVFFVLIYLFLLKKRKTWNSPSARISFSLAWVTLLCLLISNDYFLLHSTSLFMIFSPSGWSSVLSLRARPSSSLTSGTFSARSPRTGPGLSVRPVWPPVRLRKSARSPYRCQTSFIRSSACVGDSPVARKDTFRRKGESGGGGVGGMTTNSEIMNSQYKT